MCCVRKTKEGVKNEHQNLSLVPQTTDEVHVTCNAFFLVVQNCIQFKIKRLCFVENTKPIKRRKSSRDIRSLNTHLHCGTGGLIDRCHLHLEHKKCAPRGNHGSFPRKGISSLVLSQGRILKGRYKRMSRTEHAPIKEREEKTKVGC